MVAGILYYQSLPEIDTDKAGGKTTLANILGKDHALLVFRIWWPVVWVSIINLWLSGLAGWPVLFCLRSLSLPGVTATGWNSTGTGIWCVSAISRAAFPASWELPFDILPRLKPWDS